MVKKINLETIFQYLHFRTVNLQWLKQNTPRIAIFLHSNPQSVIMNKFTCHATTFTQAAEVQVNCYATKFWFVVAETVEPN